MAAALIADWSEVGIAWSTAQPLRNAISVTPEAADSAPAVLAPLSLPPLDER